MNERLKCVCECVSYRFFVVCPFLANQYKYRFYVRCKSNYCLRSKLQPATSYSELRHVNYLIKLIRFSQYKIHRHSKLKIYGRRLSSLILMRTLMIQATVIEARLHEKYDFNENIPDIYLTKLNLY